jgi:DNA-binding SARP family transcriptional activator/tetratricopeptide (TPR) repeat protein
MPDAAMLPVWMGRRLDGRTVKEIRLSLLGDSAIYIGDLALRPSASHLFALLLLLTQAPADGSSRSELQELLFSPTEAGTAPHRLRQLLYHLRRLGVIQREGPGGAILLANPIVESVTPDRRSSGDGDFRPPRALPHYHPPLPPPFLAWLEQTRDRIEQRAKAQLIRQLREAQSRQDWSTAARIADMVLLTDPLNEEVAAAGAEAHAMLGRRDEALEMADRFVRELDGDQAAAAAMRRLRARIARTALSHRAGTLRGREECLAMLAEQWEHSAAGGGRLALIVGPPGMGKTRVAEAFSAKIRLGGARVIHYLCDRQASQHPLALFSAILPELQSLRGSLGIAPEHHAALERLTPSRDTPRADLPGMVAIEARRAELQRALLDLLDAISVEQRLLIVVDDAHLLDDASCEVLRSVADRDNRAAVLVAAFARPRSDGPSRFSLARRAASYLLPRLSDEDCRELLLELRSGSPLSDEQLRWALSQAQGNPFYLYALANLSPDKGTLPGHVRSLAMCTYFALTPLARTVLESCLLLDTLATLPRVGRVAGIEEPALVGALRELEELDLVHFEGITLRGPHAILDEALRQLIPGSVSALLHTRIAGTLAEEFVAGGYSPSLAWAAVQSWLSAGNPRAAVELARRCAREAATLGEPQAGAELLSRIPRTALPPEDRRGLLDDLFDLAQAGNCQSLVLEALRERMEMAEKLNEGAQIRATLTLLAISNAIQDCGDPRDEADRLQEMLRDRRLSPATRAMAGKRLIALADVQFDQPLATDTYAHLLDDDEPAFADDSSFLSACMIYHTTFGDTARALDLIEAATPSVTTPSSGADFRNSVRDNASLALLRLGHYERARDRAIYTFEYLIARGAVWNAEFALSIVTDAEVSLGNWESAERWTQRWHEIATRRARYQSRFVSGYFSTKMLLAIHHGRYEEAERVLSTLGEFGLLHAARYRALTLAYMTLIKYWSEDAALPDSLTGELRSLYARGQSFGAQDPIVEALWCAATREGRTDEASRMLKDYLTTHRRERTRPEWNLRRTTAQDPAWAAYRSTEHGLASPDRDRYRHRRKPPERS